MQWGQFSVRVFGWGWVLFGLMAGFAQPVCAQAGVVAPQTTVDGELQSLGERAALVFAGQVVSIERRGGVVDVTFQVEQPVVGQPGATYRLREWAGLWPPGQFRYTVGERALIFLNGTSAAGLGSPVDGAEGVVPVVVQGADAPELLDVRRLAAALVRSVGTPLPTLAEGAIPLSDAIKVIVAARTPGVPRPRAPMRVALPERGLAARVGSAVPATPISAVQTNGAAALAVSRVGVRAKVAYAGQ